MYSMEITFWFVRDFVITLLFRIIMNSNVNKKSCSTASESYCYLSEAIFDGSNEKKNTKRTDNDGFRNKGSYVVYIIHQAL